MLWNSRTKTLHAESLQRGSEARNNLRNSYILGIADLIADGFKRLGPGLPLTPLSSVSPRRMSRHDGHGHVCFPCAAIWPVLERRIAPVNCTA